MMLFLASFVGLCRLLVFFLSQLNATDEDAGDVVRYEFVAEPQDGNAKFIMDFYGECPTFFVS